jgi:hypothetical protein
MLEEFVVEFGKNIVTIHIHAFVNILLSSTRRDKYFL